MAELVIKLQKYIGESTFNWDTFEFEMATSAEDVRMQVEWAQYMGETVDSLCFEIGTCFGGSTFDGTEIYNYVQGLGIPVRTRILSFAASMATIIMLAGDVCEIDASAQIMVHGPAVDASGTVTQVASGLKGLTGVHEALRDIYVARTGQPVEVVEEWMSKDTFFTASEALAAGLVTKVIPIAPKAAPELTDAQARARRAKFAGIVARASQRTRAAVPTPKAKPGAAVRPQSPAPMATKKTTPGSNAAPRRSAAAPATPPAGNAPAKLTPKQQAVAAFAKQMGVTITMEGAEVEVPTSEVVGTVLAEGAGTLYTDGELVEGSAVYNDEALTVVTADGVYETEDGRDITVTDGVVESIATASEASSEEEPASAAAITAAVTAAMAPFSKRLDEVAEKVQAFSKVVPSAPRAKTATGSQGPDPKASTPKPKAAHHSTL
ncbi:hypothetical protein GCM10023185_31070 [Hymenobacter saemangeumensis]|uniref:Clp protease ClpP n=1 Tax=Hymenobacter saemangeumensis TaxID=1084522 RepID=A0ABP8ILX2_9BACT